MDPRHWITLELPKILEQLATYTSFSAGAEKARSLTPSPLLDEVGERLETTTEARALLQTHPQITLGGTRDVRPLVESAKRGGALAAPDLLDVQGTLLAAQALRRSLTRLREQFPRLADTADRFALCPELVEAIGRCLDARGEVRDDASPQLAQVRRELRLAHDRLLDRLNRIIASPKNRPFLQEPIITMRQGRYVIPLKADFKGRIRGIVHDRSASGATLFIEPFSVVDLNNAWRELQMREEQEVQRILTALSAHVAACGAQIEHTVDALADLDLAFAKARYADALDAVSPAIRPPATSNEGRIHLLQARHPLLDPRTVVPIDVVLDRETQILVITGPNTGGKTVTLKTVGLLVLMTQAGLHIPAAQGSALPVFEAVYADIGDEQSIEQSLSTFSSHLTNILSFINRADERSLVLLDELGAGTDPAEGSALARALLETFRRRGATTFVATHYPELKAYAQLTPGVKNGSVEFDPQTLRPTYRLTIGLPGRSNAFAIARQLGLDEEIVGRAESLISRQDRQTEALLADIHRLRLQAAEERDAAHAARREAERLAEEVRRRLARIEEERAAILEEARREAVAEVEGLREEIRALRRQMHAAGALPEGVVAVEKQLEEMAAWIAGQPSEADLLAEVGLPAPAQRPLRPGDPVWVTPLNVEGEILSISGKEAEVQAGPARVRVRLDQLLPRTAEEEVQPAGVAYEAPPVQVRLDLRGATVEEALEQLDRHLDAALLANLPWVQVIHGKGTGALRQAVRDFLRAHPLVASYRAGDEGEGGEGVTVAVLVQP